MKDVLWWIWFGPWWAPFVGALYLGVLLAIVFGWALGPRMRRRS